MTTNFPSSIDNFTNPTTSDTLASVSHSAQHADVNDAVEAIETALLDGAPLHIDDANERVGIGTQTPDRALTVDSTETNIANFKGSNATGAISFMGSGTTSNTQVRIGAIGDGMKLIAGDTERIRIDSSGNVGINDTSPSYKLDVNGDINATGRIRTGNEAHFGGAIYCYTYPYYTWGSTWYARDWTITAPSGCNFTNVTLTCFPQFTFRHSIATIKSKSASSVTFALSAYGGANDGFVYYNSVP